MSRTWSNAFNQDEDTVSLDPWLDWSYIVTHMESRASAVNLLESGEQSYIKAINDDNNNLHIMLYVHAETRK